MRSMTIILAAAAAAAVPSAAAAQSTTASVGPFPVTGNVPALCSGGTLANGTSSFDLGVLINTSTGFLRTDLAAPPKVLAGAFCTSRSRITISATPLQSVTDTGVPGTGFSRTVNYTASASGWTTTPASFTTGAATNGAAAQDRSTAFQGDISVGIGGFSTAGGDTLRLIADPSYQGIVTVTLAVAN
jgi:hypothetical protein